MNFKILTAAMLLLSAPALASGICIVCPPGYDCSGNNPALDGTTGQVLTRTAGGTAWQALPAGVSPYTSTPAALGTAAAGSSSNYARGDHVHPMPTAAQVGVVIPVGNDSNYTVKSHCATNNSGTPDPGPGRYCWCAKETINKGIVVRASWVFYRDYARGDDCATDCLYHCPNEPYWRASSVW